jgi:hypothetical protein
MISHCVENLKTDSIKPFGAAFGYIDILLLSECHGRKCRAGLLLIYSRLMIIG